MKLFHIMYDDGMCESYHDTLMRGPDDADIKKLHKEFRITDRKISFTHWLVKNNGFAYRPLFDPEITVFNEYDGECY